jgi:hypothetical protein
MTLGRLATVGVVLSFALLLASGCGTRLRKPAEPSSSPLVAPAAAGARAVSQVVRGVYGDRTITLQGALTLENNVLTLIGLTTLGQRAYTIRFDGDQVTTERAPFVPASIEPERLLADVQLAYWPLESLRTRWAAAGLEVSEPHPGTRRVRRGDRLIAEVHYASPDPWQGRLWLANFEFDYSLTIDTAPMAP